MCGISSNRIICIMARMNSRICALKPLTDLAGELERDPETFGDKIRVYRDGARLLEAGWTPPARLLPAPWTRTAEDHDATREEPHRASAVQPISIGRQSEPDTIASPAVVEHADEYPDLAANPDPVGIPVRFPNGGISVHLGDGEWQDIDRTPGAFTAVRLWPHHNHGVEDYRLYDHTGLQVAQADVAIIDERAHIANIEAEGGAHALGIRALRTVQSCRKSFQSSSVSRGFGRAERLRAALKKSSSTPLLATKVNRPPGSPPAPRHTARTSTAPWRDCRPRPDFHTRQPPRANSSRAPIARASR
jgi:hypothetical protein